MPRAFERHTSPGLGLPALRRMGDCLGEDEAGLIGEELLMGYRHRGLRVERAPASHRCELVSVEKRLHLLSRHHAMVLAVAPAAWR